MAGKKNFRAFAFMGAKGGITIKNRFKLLDNEQVSFNGGVAIPISTFGNRWAICEQHRKKITKAEVKEFIVNSLNGY